MDMPMSINLLVLVLLWSMGLVVFAQPGAVDALRAFKQAVGDPPELNTWTGSPCFPAAWRGVECGYMRTIISLKLSNLGLTGLLSSELGNLTSLVVLWLDNNHLYGSIPSGLGKLKNLTSLRLSGNNLHGEVPATFAELSSLKELLLDGNQINSTVQLPQQVNIKLDGNSDICSPNIPSCAPSLAPALVFEGGPPKQGTRKSHVGAIAGAVAGAVVLVAIAIATVSYCLIRVKRWPSAGSDTASSDPSAQVDWAKGGTSSIAEGVTAVQMETQHIKQFSFNELEHATKNFNPSNMIGKGRFGYVYKGLLEDGTIVAIKTRISPPSHEFITEVVNLSQYRHKNLVSILGFCQEHGHQMIVYDYLPNGSVCSHLYDSSGNPIEELDFKQRVSIALGAARGLEFLHHANPPRVHQDFKTRNILLDENLMAKVTDFGLSRVLVTSHVAMPSCNGAGAYVFADPAAATSSAPIDTRSDVYSYGVFLLELISGREAINANRPQPTHSIVDWALSLKDTDNIGAMVDRSLMGSLEDAKALLMMGLHCTAIIPERRPSMSDVANQVENILSKEKGIFVTSEAPTVVTLGSELFR